ncbi:winged helix-turn-helix domain-containing protein [Thioclava sp. SK-1]|uniref:HTH domain-containing protein n=1 Tax=Thioclava sp. SK-1 TaxID=1889770 RepID=UPI0009F3C7B9
MSWPEAIKKVLKNADKELHYTGILVIILLKGMVKSAGTTPESPRVYRRPIASFHGTISSTSRCA